jgi:DNA polymerase V
MNAQILGPLNISAEPFRLPIYQGASCGFPSPAENFSEPPLSLDELVRIREPSTFLVKAEGESMLEAGIFSGDVLIVVRGQDARSGDIIVARLGAEFTVKELEITATQTVRLLPANPLHQPIVLDEADELEVWGVVTWNLHCLTQASNMGRSGGYAARHAS